MYLVHVGMATVLSIIKKILKIKFHCQYGVVLLLLLL